MLYITGCKPKYKFTAIKQRNSRRQHLQDAFLLYEVQAGAFHSTSGADVERGIQPGPALAGARGRPRVRAPRPGRSEAVPGAGREGGGGGGACAERSELSRATGMLRAGLGRRSGCCGGLWRSSGGRSARAQSAASASPSPGSGARSGAAPPAGTEPCRALLLFLLPYPAASGPSVRVIQPGSELMPLGRGSQPLRRGGAGMEGSCEGVPEGVPEGSQRGRAASPWAAPGARTLPRCPPVTRSVSAPQAASAFGMLYSRPGPSVGIPKSKCLQLCF